MRVLAIIVSILALAVPGAAVAQEEVPENVETTKGQSEPTYENSVTEQYYVETDHGTIYGEVIRPLTADGEDVKAPVILTYSPYNIIGSPVNQAASIADDSTAAYYVPRGYARAVFDVVGTRESSGCYDYGGIAERETGAAVVDFLGAQPWANGKVGMIGGSYDGTTAIAAAVQAPKHLTTIIPQVAIDRWYDYAFGGGVRYFLNNENPTDEGFDTPLAFDFGFGFLPPADVTNPDQFAAAVQTRINPCERIQHTNRAYEFDPVYDEFWEERDYRRLAGNVKASVFVEAGWLDHNVKHWDSTRFFMALPENHPKKLVMGQWNHTSSQFADAQDVRHAWFDYWLLGLETGVMELPAVDTQLNTQEGSNREQEPTWPPPGTIDAQIDLLSEGEPGVGELAVTTGNVSWVDQRPPVTEEEMFSGPESNRFIRLLSAPLEADVRISGSPLVDLLLTSSAEHTQFTPVLYEQTADGGVNVITRGFLNVRNRDGLDVSEPAPVDEPYRAPVQMWDTDYLVKEGSQLGLVIASDNADWALDDDDPTGTNTPVFADQQAAQASVLRLPVSRGQAAVGAYLPAGACDEAFVPKSGFGDIAGNVHRDNIACIAWYLITQGVSDTRYDPAGSVTRGQMASYLARLAVEGGIELPSDARDVFTDDDGTTHERNINALAALDLVEGTSGRRYAPRRPVTRAQMASFIARLHERVTGALPSDPPNAFTDDDGNVHEPSINALAHLGVVKGLRDRDGDGRVDFFPGVAVPRDQMATFVINDLRLYVEAGKAHPGGATVTVPQRRAPKGGAVRGTVTANKRLASLTADGCGVANRTVAVGDDGGFTVQLPDSQEAGRCDLRLTAATANRDAGGETQRITYTVPVVVE